MNTANNKVRHWLFWFSDFEATFLPVVDPHNDYDFNLEAVQDNILQDIDSYTYLLKDSATLVPTFLRRFKAHGL